MTFNTIILLTLLTITSTSHSQKVQTQPDTPFIPECKLTGKGHVSSGDCKRIDSTYVRFYESGEDSLIMYEQLPSLYCLCQRCWNGILSGKEGELEL